MSTRLLKNVPVLTLLLAGVSQLGVAAPAKTTFFRPQATVKAKTLQATNVAVVNAASYLPGISPGGLVTIFGQNLSSVTGVVVAGTDPLPNELAGVSVLMNGLYAPVFAVAYANGEDQISVQVPYNLPVGPGTVHIDVYNNGVLEASLQEDSFTEDPGIFMYDGNYAVAVRYPDNSLVGLNNPAYPGDILTVYTTGLGPLTAGFNGPPANLVDGYGAPSNPLAYTQDPFTVTVAGQQCEILFSGLAPGFVGLYQLNIVLPSNLPRGNLDMLITSPYASSGVAILPVN